jgi:hypothetical protein
MDPDDFKIKSDYINIAQQIQMMTVSEKVKYALHAGKDARSILIKDPNKQVALAVINSPRITEEEVLTISLSRSVLDEVLRVIIRNREWIKNYAISLALVNNPKTPMATAISILPRINKRDLSLLSKNKNVPEAVRIAVRKILSTRAG